MTQIAVHLNPDREIWQVAREIDDKIDVLIAEGVLSKCDVEQLFPDHESARFRAMFMANCRDCRDADRVLTTIQSVDGVDIAHLAAHRGPAI
jgi:hypothetical protein